MGIALGCEYRDSLDGHEVLVAKQNVPFIPASNADLGLQNVVGLSIPHKLLSRPDISFIAKGLYGVICYIFWLCFPVFHWRGRGVSFIDARGLLVMNTFKIVVEPQLNRRSGQFACEIDTVEARSAFVDCSEGSRNV